MRTIMSASASTASSSPDATDHQSSQQQSRGRQSSSSSSNNNDGNSVSDTNQNGLIYEAGQKIYCTHENNIYEARILKTAIRENIPQYFVHYHGWSKNWDEWVVDDRILQINDENLVKYEESCKRRNSRRNRRSGGGGDNRRSLSTVTNSAFNNSDSVSNAPRKSTTATTASSSSASSSSSSSSVVVVTTTTTPSSSIANQDLMDEKSARRKRKRTSRSTYVTEEDHKLINEKPKIKIPMKLSEILMEDYLQIYFKRKILQLVDLKKTAQNLLDDYLADRIQQESESSSSSSSTHQSSLEKKFTNLDPPLNFTINPFSSNLRFDNIEMNTRKSCCEEYVKNIRIYFNTVLPTHLLFNIERLQYLEIISNPNHDISNNQQDNNNTNNQSNESLDTTTTTTTMPKMRSRKNSDSIVIKNSKSIKTSSSTKTTTSTTTTTVKDSNNHNQSKEPIEIYSPIHLLRLFTKLGSYLQYYYCDKNFFRLLNLFNDDFFDFCMDNYDEYFGDDNLHYYEPKSDYIERSANISSITMAKQQQTEHSSIIDGQSSSSLLIDGDDNSSTNENMNQD
ncbi:uncharacterized protein LOC124490469 [Dermatophagoides farinae]|uniref:uncharacterized protein LOC124490469 n=1 Tax=Dermatophagoides farinae TaxID=6954 RepID=UPI003F5F064C